MSTSLLITTAVMAVANFALSRIFATEQKFTVDNGRLNDLNLVGSKYGENIPYALGVNRLPINVVWTAPIKEHVHSDTQDAGGGGKGGGGGGAEITTISYSYTADFGGVISYNEQAELLAIFADKKLVWQKPADSGPVYSGSVSGGGSFEFLTGAAGQAAPAIAESYLGAGNCPAYRGRASLWFSDLACPRGTAPNIEVIVSSAAGGGNASVRDVINLVASEAGIPVGFIQSAAVNAEVAGAIIRDGAAGSLLEPYLTAFGVQGRFVGDAYEFTPIEGLESVVTIPENDLVFDGSNNIFPVKVTRDEDMPRTISLKYFDSTRNNQISTQRAFRKTGLSSQTINLTLEASLTPSQAATATQTLLYRAWAAQRKYGPFSLPRQYMYLTPGDVITVNYNGREHLLRLTQVTIGANLVLRCEGESYDPNVNALPASGDSGYFPGQGLPDFGTTYVSLLDFPALLPALVDKPGIYLAATGTGTAWRGARLEVSTDGTGEGGWREIAATNVPITMGYAYTKLEPPPVEIGALRWDQVSDVYVQLYSGTLQSVTDTQLLSGANAFVVGKEIIQARDVVALGGGTYHLTYLLRGRRGTEEFMYDHDVNDVFVAASQMTFVPMQLANRGVPMNFRLTPMGSDLPTLLTYAPQLMSARPRRPEYLKATRNGVGDMTISFRVSIRRMEELPNVGESIPDYSPQLSRVRVYSGDWSTVRHEFVLTDATTYTYTATQQNADFGFLLDAANVGVAQYSPYYGYGVENRSTI